MSTKPYIVKFTHAAQVAAQGRLAAVEESIRGELAEEMMDGGGLDCLDHPSSLLFHVLGSVENPDWIVYGKGYGILVDVAEFEEYVVSFAKGHPFSGKKMLMPIPPDEDD